MITANEQLRVLTVIAGQEEELDRIALADACSDVSPTQVFAALGAFNQAGLVDARWEHKGKSLVLVYRITESGKVALRKMEEE